MSSGWHHRCQKFVRGQLAEYHLWGEVTLRLLTFPRRCLDSKRYYCVSDAMSTRQEMAIARSVPRSIGSPKMYAKTTIVDDLQSSEDFAACLKLNEGVCS